MGKPNLFIVGAAKSGTTSLHNYLNQHPNIFMCNPKEPHFLINKEIGVDRIPVGIPEKSEYEDLFTEGEGKKYRGESSVMYLMYPEIVIPKIKNNYLENTKIIIMLRNPVERAYSGFHHVKRYNVKENIQDFTEAWKLSEERYFNQKDMTPASRYQELGLYYNQVQSYLNEFKDNLHIIIYDDYKSDFKSEMNKVFDFLEVENIEIDSDKRHMVGGWQWEDERLKKLMMKKNPLKSAVKMLIPFKGLRKSIRKKIQENNTVEVQQMIEKERIMMKEFYRTDVQKLSGLLNRKLNFWVE
ncbi:MAG: sulfotransferase domain-containing protein [Flavobacteriales bacterium]|nr:sulfotransferase domain-containing protein [Flavobacteriales bacterium]